MGLKKKSVIKDNEINAKLSFFDFGWPDNVLHKIQGRVSDKLKGFEMIESIMQFFNIGLTEMIRYIKKNSYARIRALKGSRPPAFTRDGRGRIISPFSKN